MKRIDFLLASVVAISIVSGCGSSSGAPAAQQKVFLSFSTSAVPIPPRLYSAVEFTVILPQGITVPLNPGTTNEVNPSAFTTPTRLNAALTIMGSYSALSTTAQKVHITATDTGSTPQLSYGKFLVFACNFTNPNFGPVTMRDNEFDAFYITTPPSSTLSLVFPAGPLTPPTVSVSIR
jgi:hypothetical protein